MKNITLRNSGLSRRLRRASGMTLIEISLVIALLLGLIAVVFMGIGSYRKGADRAKCKIQLAQVQKAIRAYSNFQNLAIGGVLATTDAFGAGKALENQPTCPSGGTYAWTGTVPAVSIPYGNCDYTDADGVTTHVLTTGATGDSKDW
ncbi:MAG: hypothetical protein JWO89_1672 [Verrucomicrobiaceae bacterium]|nr:hypothetical protein [Verrucomicrobiaceae bacterium]MDB6116781.1 hypothetical protein [Verrucomicrobiaceae bacterium]